MSDDLIARRSRYGTLEQRFWQKVEKSDGCWNWTGNRADSGRSYGQIISGGERGKLIMAHRLSWTLHNGPIPSLMLVLHHCDNTACVNPAHLFLGTYSDNAKDAARKGLLGRNQKLSPTLVAKIRAMRADGLSGTQIGRVLGISAGHARKVASGIAWNHV